MYVSSPCWVLNLRFELNAGLGAAPNLKYYKDYASQIIGLDPNLATRQYAEKEIENLGLAKDAVTFVQGRAENIPFDDNSIDSIVCTTVLCSVTDPDAVLKECKRVLKPGGKFYFIEHVAAPRNSRLRQVQGAIRPVISFLGEGCNPTRETGDVIKAAGFRHVELDAIDVDFPLPFRPFSPHIFGVCTK
jgi:ubiquinone/menaquinone biosynthesis C-methylase UbiE